MSIQITGEMSGAIDCKRFYMPGVVATSVCPRCGNEAERDLSDPPMSYPVANKTMHLNFYHECADGEEQEWSVPVRLIVKLETE